MRIQFCQAMVERAQRRHDLIFLTGDLGFMALEPLQQAMGRRFINAGVAEQNMVSVAAGLAREGLEAWAYSIAPFCYARPFEQIRNDVAFHGLPVRLVGNGGGYGYGVMGPTHHAIEDYGVLLCLPSMTALMPVFDEDVGAVVAATEGVAGAAYLRLGRGEKPKGWDVPAYAAWRQLLPGGGTPLVAAGPLAGSYLEAFLQQAQASRPPLWAVAELPLARHPLPPALVAQVQATGGLVVAEEHVSRGGLGAELAMLAASGGLGLRRLVHLHAQAHHYERYGSQTYLRRLSGLDAASALAAAASVS
jgi:transketolase